MALLVFALCTLSMAVHAQPPMPGLSSWTNPWSSMTGGGFPTMPYPCDAMPTMPHDHATPMLDRAYDAWPLERRDFVDRRTYPSTTDTYQPDLTGSWRGSGGETVEIQRNRARIWGGSGSHQSCSCVFFLVGQRIIAYSPDTDAVRKYWFNQTSARQFELVDENGNQLIFWRTR
jgi:hypothetical protein